MQRKTGPPQSSVLAVFFDAVGTLIHPEPPAPVVYAQVGRRFGSSLTTEEIRERFWDALRREEAADRAYNLRTSETRELERWRNTVGTVLDDVEDPESCFAVLFAHFARPDAWRCEAGVEEVLRELADRGYDLGLASNYDARLRSVVTGLPALRPLRHLVISSEVGWRKPASAFFEAMTRSVGVPAENMLFVGDDSANDYEGARAVGMGAVLFDPQNAAPTHGIDQIHRLTDLLSKLAMTSQR